MKNFNTAPRRVIMAIDRFTAWYVRAVALLLVPMILGNVIEVFMRYLFDSPTTWAADITVMTFGSFFMLG